LTFKNEYTGKINLKKGVLMKKSFSPEKRAEILAYIEKYDAKNRRGGQSAASKKFKVSRVTIINWLKGGAAGKNSQTVAVKPVKTAAPKTRKSEKVISDGNIPIIDALESINECIAEIVKALKKAE
jgi:hypothetical protein